MPNSLYDVYLGDIASLQGFRCRSLVRDSAPLVASRFSTSQLGETDLDLLKAQSLDNLSGGMFQRIFKDSHAVARAIGLFNKYDESVYPVPPRSSATALSSGYYPQAKVESDMYSFVAYGAFSAGTYYNLLYKVTASGGHVAVTLPVALQNNAGSSISGLALHRGFLYVGSGNTTGGANCHRYNIAADTWQDISGVAVKFCALRNVLYAINSTSVLFSCTSEDIAGSAVFTGVTVVGAGNVNAMPTDCIEFNGALWISKPDGLYRFDGVAAVKVLSLVTKQLCVFNGALFFFSGNWLYKFDGATVTRLQFFGTQEVVGSSGSYPSLSLSSNSDFLFISSVVLTSGYTSTDKTSSTANALKRIYTYDGAAFMLFHEVATSGTSFIPALLFNHDKLYDLFAILTSSWETNLYSFTLSDFFSASAVTSSSVLEFTTSEFDAGFPSIFKSLEQIDLAYSGIISGDSLVVKYQYYNGSVWSSWITAGTITSSTSNTLDITSNSNKLFKRLKVSVAATFAPGSTLSVKGLTLRHTLQPRMRWRWQAHLMAEGNSIVTDRAGSAITADSNALTNVVVSAAKQKTPIFLLSPDYGLVKTQITSSTLSFIIKGQIPIYTDPYSEYPLVAVKNNSAVWELLRVSTVSYSSGSDETTITVLERNYYGVTAAQINANAEFHLAYKVYVTRVLRDAPILDDSVYNEQATSGESQIQREFIIELTEV